MIGHASRWSDSTPWRRIVAAFLIASFFCLSYAAQTHIYTPAAPSQSQVVKSLGLDGVSPAGAHSTKHDSDDAADCPLCHVVNQGGALLVPFLVAFLALSPVLHNVLPGLVEQHRTSVLRRGHQTRGPPLL